MLPFSHTSTDRLRAALGATLALALVVAPALARRGGTPAADGPVVPDKQMTRKAAVEITKARVDQLMQGIRTCVAAAPPGESRTTLEGQLPPLEHQLKDALWSYNVGNYEEAMRRYAVVERAARISQTGCEKVRQAVERCSKSVTQALERIRSWGIKIARLQDPTFRAHCEALFTDAEKGLISLEKTCATTDPGWVSAQIPIAVKPLDEALKKAK